MSARRWNDLQWDGKAGHYEVHYLTLTDPASGVGCWIRYTMLAPRPGTGHQPSCSLWFLAMDPQDPALNVGLKADHPVTSMSAIADPFRLQIGAAWLSDRGAAGTLEHAGRRAAWDLRWEPSLPAYGHVHPVLRATRIAKTVLFLPHPDLAIEGWVEWDGRRLELSGARGGQAHLWGSKHAERWAWAHCNDFTGADGRPRPGSFVDGVSVMVPRFGRTVGPNTPVVARVDGSDMLSTGPLSVVRNASEFSPAGWSFEARAGRDRRLRGEVTARAADLVGVTYHDPDGELAHCYNTEVASMRLEVMERAAGGWRKLDELRSDGRAHFEYAQREPLPDLPLAIA